MSSDPIEPHLLGGENPSSSEASTPHAQSDLDQKLERMFYRVRDHFSTEFRAMNDRLSQLTEEVRRLCGTDPTAHLERIDQDLRRFEEINAQFNATGMFNQGDIQAFDLISGRLHNIEQDISCLKDYLQGSTGATDDTIKDYLHKINDRLGSFDERLGSLGSDFHKLEDRMFANVDGVVDDESGFITVAMQKLDYEKLSKNTEAEILQTLHGLGEGWNKIKSIRLKPSKESGKKYRLIINFMTRESERHIRKHITVLDGVFGLEYGFFCLDPMYTLHVVDLVPHFNGEKKAMRENETDVENKKNKDLEALLRETLNGEKNNTANINMEKINVQVSYDRMLIKTTVFEDVSKLCLTGVILNGHYYEIKPFCVQGSPLFCFTCWKPSHFKDDCSVKEIVCGRCSGNHDSRGCTAPFRCCNCHGSHPAWSIECTSIPSKNEHRNSAWYRRLSPHWAENLVKTGKRIIPSDTKTQNTKSSAATGSPTAPVDQEDPPSSQQP
ncbi:hypothetical protein IL306_008839 [Fusarium sp. DS 682]|nr:hypothetical protein IL306_008839 [Fusarium sp. DS 682]